MLILTILIQLTTKLVKARSSASVVPPAVTGIALCQLWCLPLVFKLNAQDLIFIPFSFLFSFHFFSISFVNEAQHFLL